MKGNPRTSHFTLDTPENIIEFLALKPIVPPPQYNHGDEGDFAILLYNWKKENKEDADLLWWQSLVERDVKAVAHYEAMIKGIQSDERTKHCTFDTVEGVREFVNMKLKVPKPIKKRSDGRSAFRRRYNKWKEDNPEDYALSMKQEFIRRVML